MQSIENQKKTNEDPIENVAWRGLASTYKTVYSYIMSDLRQYGLTPPQYTLLWVIGTSRSRQLTMSEIGKEMVVTFANITTIVDNLEKLRYVKRLRDPSDRRLVIVKLTGEGSRLFRKINQSHRKEVAKLMRVLDHEELQNLVQYADAIRKNASILSSSYRKANQKS
jgi:DNA-binding MarR family transcriptional regulator